MTDSAGADQKLLQKKSHGQKDQAEDEPGWATAKKTIIDFHTASQHTDLTTFPQKCTNPLAPKTLLM